jgi:hypothetical protein
VPSDDDEADLIRYWFTFDLVALAPPRPKPGTISLNSGTIAYRVCHQGVGVTGYNEADCLALVGELIAPDALPVLLSATRSIDVSSLDIEPPLVGVTAWRGVWYPAVNRDGPVVG